MTDNTIPMAKIYELIGELYVNNNLLSSHINELTKANKEAVSRSQFLEKQLHILEGQTNNGSSQEE